MTQCQTYPCHAKINMILDVGAPGENGYHPICSWMVPVSLCDELTVRRLPDPRAPSTFDIRWAPDAPQTSPIDWPVADDLACLACQMVEQHVGRPLPVGVTLAKRVPVGAGMGGGSSDAAAMLRALNDLFELELSPQRLCDLALGLGSDVPFFLFGASAIVSGLGERVEPLPLPRPLDLVVAFPPLRCNTGAVYRRFDQVCPGARIDPQRPQQIRSLVGSGAPQAKQLINGLSEAACSLVPELKQLRQRCREATGCRVGITGSGSGLFLLADDPPQAQRHAEAIICDVGLSALVVQTL